MSARSTIGTSSTRASWAASPMPAVIVPDALGADLAAKARRAFEHAGYTRYGLVDRGSYDEIRNPYVPELTNALAGIASEITGRDLSVIESRALRLHPGDYLLLRHDRVYEDRPVELVLDVSPAAVESAEVHYRHRGQVFFTMPCSPGSLAIVERGPTVMCNHTYVSKRWTSASVVRLVALLRETVTARAD